MIEQIKVLFLELSSSFSELEQSKVFTFVTFIRRLNIEQLIDFIDNAIKKPWKHPPKTVHVKCEGYSGYAFIFYRLERKR